MLTYPWKCTALHCNHLGNTWKPLVLMTQHFDYCLSASEGDNQSVRSSAPVVSRCFPGGYNVKLYISRGRLAWWLLAFLHSDITWYMLYSGIAERSKCRSTMLKVALALHASKWLNVYTCSLWRLCSVIAWQVTVIKAIMWFIHYLENVCNKCKMHVLNCLDIWWENITVVLASIIMNEHWQFLAFNIQTENKQTNKQASTNLIPLPPNEKKSKTLHEFLVLDGWVVKAAASQGHEMDCS